MNLDSYTIQLNQDRETPLSAFYMPGCRIRYAYTRSIDSRQMGEKGQDAVEVFADRDQVCFALCDGVSQSFMGDLAANLVSSELVHWLADELFGHFSEAKKQLDTRHFLEQLAVQKTKHIHEYAIPQVPEFLSAVLREKRDNGSETMVLGGRIDFVRDEVFLVWMGDSRLRLWTVDGDEITAGFEGNFGSGERWSSRRGPVGQTHFWSGKVSGITQVAAYSDGLVSFDSMPSMPMTNEVFQQVFSQIAGAGNDDDASFIDINLF